MRNVGVGDVSSREGAEGRMGVTSAGRSARSFRWVFSSGLWNPCRERRAVSHITRQRLQESQCCPSACCVVSPEVKSLHGGVSVLQVGTSAPCASSRV